MPYALQFALEAIVYEGWNCCENPPQGELNCWTKQVVVLTNFGRLLALNYFHEKESGCWARKKKMHKDEYPKYWKYPPREYCFISDDFS
jgi:hypothetical protein